MPAPTTSARTASPEALARDVLSRMTLEQKVGQVFMLGFVGTTLTDDNRALIQGLHLGGVTLFARNIEDGPQLARLDTALQTIADPVPLFISVDQEGGLVVRVTDGATRAAHTSRAAVHLRSDGASAGAEREDFHLNGHSPNYQGSLPRSESAA